jgi:hypothetical protein
MRLAMLDSFDPALVDADDGVKLLEVATRTVAV